MSSTKFKISKMNAVIVYLENKYFLPVCSSWLLAIYLKINVLLYAPIHFLHCLHRDTKRNWNRATTHLPYTFLRLITILVPVWPQHRKFYMRIYGASLVKISSGGHQEMIWKLNLRYETRRSPLDVGLVDPMVVGLLYTNVTPARQDQGQVPFFN